MYIILIEQMELHLMELNLKKILVDMIVVENVSTVMDKV